MKTEFRPHTPNRKQTETLYDRIGGMETLDRLAAAFYARIERDERIRPMFRADLSRSGKRQALFLAEVFGGPKLYTKSKGRLSLTCIHAPHPIGPEEVAAWLGHMDAALEEIGLPENLRASLREYFHGEAAHLGDPFLEFYDLSPEELEKQLNQNPDLVHWRGGFAGSLLHYAAGSWDVEKVGLLLAHGADAHDQDHSPLYCCANRYVPLTERSSPAGRSVAELLIRHGMEVNAASGSGDQTPLHMAARRGNVTIAEVLLDAGADIDRRDKKGETPLRRAINCRQEPMVKLLLERGADPNLPDQRGLTPLQAAERSKVSNLFFA